MSDDKIELYGLVREIGVQQAVQGEQIKAMQGAMKEMRTDTRETRDAVVGAKASWKVLTIASAAGGGIIGILFKYLPFLKT